MKIKISNIVIPWYAPREEVDEEFISELAASMNKDGQWDDVIVRHNEAGEYELISGFQRVTAAKSLKWDELDGKVLDVTENDAAVMALETNILRRGLKEIEEGKAIQKMIDKYDYTHKQVAERLRKSKNWVSNRLSLAMDITDSVKKAMIDLKISVTQAIEIGKLSKKDQDKFLKIVLQKVEENDGNPISVEETKILRKRFMNDTIFTIGYSGWDIDDFINTLKENKISVLVDIRENVKSQRKPEFSGRLLEKRVQQIGIKYFGRPQLGVPWDIRAAVFENGLSTSCFKEWYIWHVTKRDEKNKAIEVGIELKDVGSPAFMCMERYPIPKGKQEHYCHRDFLAELILKEGIFEKRVDL
ncbi:MAG: ParB/RepB/Spo0J family partition protein [Candidatus Hodarchaeales archaeon]